MWDDPFKDARAGVDLGPPNLPSLLQIHPELRSRVEVSTEAQRRVCGDAAFRVEDRRYAVRGDVDRLGQCIRRKAEFIKFLAKDFAGVYRSHAALACHLNVPLLVVVHDLYIVRPVIAPAEADTPLGIDPDAVLAISVPAKRFKTVAPQSGQITQVVGVVEDGQTT